MKFRGRVWKFGDDISTDHIAPGRYFHLRSNLPELAKHTLEDAREDFAPNVKKGDIIVGGKNFGLGSSREHAPTIIKLVGVPCIIAKSFARIFFRNAVNLGLVPIVADTDLINEGDEIEVDLAEGVIKDITNGAEIRFTPISPAMLKIIEDGGIIEHLKKHGDFNLD